MSATGIAATLWPVSPVPESRPVADDFPPDDVWQWVQETYTDEGVLIWLGKWRTSGGYDRERMVSAARTEPMGT
jgi:hypothetical protein